MHKRLSRLFGCLLALVLLTGCAKETNGQTALAELTPTPTATESEPAVGLPNPIVSVDSYAALLSAVPGVMLSDAPQDAQNVTYCYINGQPVIAQIEFELDDNAYTYRAAAAAQDAQADISGIYDELAKSAELTAKGNITTGGEYTLRYAAGETKGLATWYYAPTQCQYSLYTPTGCDVSQQIEEVVDILLPILTDAAGNPLPLTSNTPIPAIQEGKISGVVVEVQANNIIINTDNGNTLQFLLTHLQSVTARTGDTVEIVYSGNVIDAPEAISVTVTKTAPVQPQIHGTVIQFSAGSVFVQTTTVNTFGFVIDASTRFTGLSDVLKNGNTVTVTYTGELADGPVANEIETTAVSSDPVPTAKPDPVNKSLKGLVTSLTSKRVTITTDNGHTYTFERDGSTVMTGDYALELLSRIRVIYDGYASQGPHAKQIDVLAPPDPTPPSPVSRTISGVVTMQAGNGLVVQADSGRSYSFLLGAPTIVGSGGEGSRITVTFTDDGYGNYTVTRIVYETPIIYGPGPVIDDPSNDTWEIGTGASANGNVPIGSGATVG